MAKEPGRLQLDMRDVPIDVIANLKLRAFAADTTVTGLCREVLIAEARRPENAAHDLPPATWEPLR